MLKNYLKIAFRNLKKHKIFSVINILGLTLGISVCLIISLFILNENSFDSYNKNAAQIYKLIDTQNNSSGIDYRVAGIITSNFPEIQKACYLQVIKTQIGTSYLKNALFIDNIMSADKSFFTMFTIPFVYGNPNKPFENSNSVVITESTAKKLFGKVNPIGKQIKIFNSWELVVSGVIKDFPDNSSINASILVNAQNNKFKFSFSCTSSSDSSSYRYPFNIYLQVKKNVELKSLISKMNNDASIFKPYIKKIELMPLTNVYLSDNTTGSSNKKGNPAFLELLLSIALIVLILAVINYINLNAAQQNKRNKETGIRKTIGAGRKEIIFLFLTESVLVTVAAYFLALCIVEISLPAFNSFLGIRLSLFLLFKFPVNLIVILSVFITGILAGIGPAIIFSSFSAARIFRGDIFKNKKKSYLRNILTVIQFTISAALIICLIVIQKQLNFVKYANLGFNKEQLLRLDIPDNNQKLPVLKNKLENYSGIKNICATFGVPGEINEKMGSGIKGKDKPVSIITTDTSFINTFGVHIIKGRKLEPGDFGKTCFINETAYKYFGWDNLTNKVFNNGRAGGFKVIAVVKDFNFTSMHKAIEPLAVLFTDNTSMLYINVRINKGSTAQTMNYIKKAWKEIYPYYPFQYQFYDEWIDSIYRQDEKFGEAIAMFALLAITISCLGILGLAVFLSEARRKEIGIRKVHGAGVINIMGLLNKDFIKLVLVSFVIACPIAWFAVNKWLQNFAYRTKISWWVFALSGFIILFIALFTVGWQAYKAATANPVESLRYE
jgi:putative ABC transport system permease protein